MLTRLLQLTSESWDAVFGGLRAALPLDLTRKIDVGARQSPSNRFVVVCVHDTGQRPDLVALLRRFRKRGFETIVVSSNAAHLQYLDVSDDVLHVASAGRDFLSYQQGYRFARNLASASDDAGIVFLNDSVWYFDKHQSALVARIADGLRDGALVAGTMILDEVPHVSGWLFALPLNPTTRIELDRLFKRSFTRKSRRYNIRFGEHRILPTLASVSGLLVLDMRGKIPAIAHCYEAVAQGGESFYVKADATVRVDVAASNLSGFLQQNAEGSEVDLVLRWLARRSSSIIEARLQMLEAAAFRARYFPPAPPFRLAASADSPATPSPVDAAALPGSAMRRAS